MVTAWLSPSLAAKVMAVSWVLSPSSATKKVANTVRAGSRDSLWLPVSSSPPSPDREDQAKKKKARAAMILMR